MVGDRRLIPLGEGAYTVSEVCRILQPTMTRHKVHYWLNTGLLSDPPVAHRGAGVPTLLSFRQLLELRTVQYLRDDLGIALFRVREAFEWILESVFADSPTDVYFQRGQFGSVIVTSQVTRESIEVHTQQGVLEADVSAANAVLSATGKGWRNRMIDIPNRPELIVNARVMAGAPTVRGTRIETSTIAACVDSESPQENAYERVKQVYPQLTTEQIHEALLFEGLVEFAVA